MAYRVDIADSALKALRKIPERDAKRIDGAILALVEMARPAGAKKLQGDDDPYRVRVGDYRIVYAIRDAVLLVLVVLVVRIAHRRDVYRGL